MKAARSPGRSARPWRHAANPQPLTPAFKGVCATSYVQGGVGLRDVAVLKATDDGFRREHGSNLVRRARVFANVSRGGPERECVVPNEPRAAVDVHERTVGQGLEWSLVGELALAAVEARTVQLDIDLGCSRGTSPGPFEGVEAFAAAFAAGSVTGGEGHGFVEKEQLGVTARRHHDAPAPLEFQNAADPLAALVRSDDLAMLIVDRAPTVAEERAAGGGAKEFAERIHTIL